MKRRKVRGAAKELPNIIELEGSIELLHFMEKFEMGLQQLKCHKTIPHKK